MLPRYAFAAFPHPRNTHGQLRTFIAKPPPLQDLQTSDDMKAARRWIDELRKSTIPREEVSLSFARSSGPGGQNVNKVNTKSTVRCPLSTKWIPAWAKPVLRKSPAYVASSDSLLVTSTVHRSQAMNVEDCLAKLRCLIVDASLAGVKNETSEEQKERVKHLQRIDDARRKKDKEHRSKLKSSRKKGDWD